MATKKEVSANIWKFYVIQSCIFWFILPISVIYLLNFGLSYSQIAMLQVINAVVVILLEIPTGVFADFIGKKWSIFLGCLFWIAALLTIGLGSVFMIFALGFFFWGIGDAFFSGAIQAFTYDTLKRAGKEKEFMKFTGKLSMVGAISPVIGSLAGGYMYQANVRLPWLLLALSLSIATVVVLTMKEPFKARKKYNVKNQMIHMKESAVFTWSHRNVRWLMLMFIASFLAPSFFMNILEQPYLTKIGFSAAGLGIIFAISFVIIGLFCLFAYRIEAKIGKKLSFFLIALSYPFVFIILSIFAIPLMVVFIILLQLVKNYNFILLETYINEYIKSKQRATVLSIRNLALNIGVSMFLLVGGFFADILSMSTLLFALGIISFASVTPLIIIKYSKWNK